MLGAIALLAHAASIQGNTFSRGAVDISASPASALVTFRDMAPGGSGTQSLVVSNAGTFELRYAISSSATNPDAKGLKDQFVLTIKTIDVTTPAVPCDNFDGRQLRAGDLDSRAGKLLGDNTAGSQAGDRTLAAGAGETLCFRINLPAAIDNSFQNASTTATFTLDAEQTVNNP